MNIWHALFLGILQGITEFLPISSSGHLIVSETFLHLPVADLAGFDVAVHFGTLFAIFVYFKKDFARLLVTFGKMVIRKPAPREQKSMVWYLIIGTIPAVLIGLFFNDFLNEQFRNSNSVAVMLILVALYFVFAEWVKKRRKRAKIGLVQAVMIGIAQAFALIPGVSRSGATIATGLVQGVDRQESARFSFLLGSIAISAATVLSLYKVIKGGLFLPSFEILLTGIVSSFIAGYASVYFLMKFLKSHTLYVFVVYKILLGIGILFLFV